MREITFKNTFGEETRVRFIKTRYVYDGSLAIAAEDYDEEMDWWEPYGNLTVNLGGFVFGTNVAYLDTNNCKRLCEVVFENGWAKQVGEGRSGYCTYPLVEFTDEFLIEVCGEDE